MAPVNGAMFAVSLRGGMVLMAVAMLTRLTARFVALVALNWIAERPSQIPFKCKAKTRYRQHDQACIITRLDDDLCEVEFNNPQRAITPGQSIVFYMDDECLGGGVIQ